MNNNDDYISKSGIVGLCLIAAMMMLLGAGIGFLSGLRAAGQQIQVWKTVALEQANADEVIEDQRNDAEATLAGCEHGAYCPKSKPGMIDINPSIPAPQPTSAPQVQTYTCTDWSNAYKQECGSFGNGVISSTFGEIPHIYLPGQMVVGMENGNLIYNKKNLTSWIDACTITIPKTSSLVDLGYSNCTLQ